MNAQVGTGIPKKDIKSKPVSLASIPKGKMGSMKVEINSFLGCNLGYRTLIACLPLAKFKELSLVANREQTDSADQVAQRPLDSNHARKLAVYILKGLVAAVIQVEKERGLSYPAIWDEIYEKLGKQPYTGLQPIVVNIRECAPDAADLTVMSNGGCMIVQLEQTHKLWVIDGQHRRRAMELLFEFLEEVRMKPTYPKRGTGGGLFSADGAIIRHAERQLWESCYSYAHQDATIAVEIHLGLNVDQERQLFHDLNQLGKKIDANLALRFDTSNPINTFTTDVLINKLGMNVSDAETKDWSKDEGAITRKDLASVNARLFLNRNSINGATAEDVRAGSEKVFRFWEAVKKIPHFGMPLARQKTVAAQPVVLRALAKLVYDFALSKRRPDNGDELFEKLLAGINQTGIEKIDFSHSNPMWQYYQLSPEERIAKGLAGLEAYLPSEETGNRDIGGYQEPYFRFGAKSNDIFPIIGDMIRWQLGLPNRQKKS
ncbi:MAG: hypothetical protein IKI30_04155 [Oxalobacter sp.]|nr:hypothetical protein [Oxalobacter sp.]